MSWRTGVAEAGCRQDVKMKWRPRPHLSTKPPCRSQIRVLSLKPVLAPPALGYVESGGADDEALRHSSFPKSQITWRDRCRLRLRSNPEISTQIWSCTRKCCCWMKLRRVFFITLILVLQTKMNFQSIMDQALPLCYPKTNIIFKLFLNLFLGSWRGSSSYLKMIKDGKYLF